MVINTLIRCYIYTAKQHYRNLLQCPTHLKVKQLIGYLYDIFFNATQKNIHFCILHLRSRSYHTSNVIISAISMIESSSQVIVSKIVSSTMYHARISRPQSIEVFPNPYC